jgi:ferrous iron transport protein B
VDSGAERLKLDSRHLTRNPKKSVDTPWIAIFGNPNCGKTALFNKLTGLHHKVGNYPGITVEKKSGWLKGHKILVKDFPGTYSLNAKSLDEKIVSDVVQSWRNPKERPLAVIVVLDSTNLTRNIYLALQIIDWGVPTIIVINMIDEMRKKGLSIDIGLLRERLDVEAVIATSAKTGEGIDELIQTVSSIVPGGRISHPKPHLLQIEQFSDDIGELKTFIEHRQDRLSHNPLIDTLRLLSEPGFINYLLPYFNSDEIEKLNTLVHKTRAEFGRKSIPYQTVEQASRFAYIDVYLADIVSNEPVENQNLSEKIDRILTHKFLGPFILIAVLLFIFNAIFSWAQWPMNLISDGLDWTALNLGNLLPDGLLKSLLIDGVIAGVGSILIFFPQIILLVFFLSLLEDSGYMARMAFMMDRLMHRIGLHGKSVLPLLSGFACAIPAVMSARTIENWRDRIQTILMIPLMSCSARLPVYTLLIAAFIPNHTVLGFLSLQALVLMGVYFLGMFTAIVISVIIKKLKKRKIDHAIVMELPPYRVPMISSLWWQIQERGKIFLLNAGTIILAVSIVLWFLASFPRNENTPDLSPRDQIEQSYAGRIGHAIEPVIKPLGYDWKIGIGIITSFAAREVIISTLSTIYNLEGDTSSSTKLIEAMKKDHYPDGRPVFNTWVALSLMVFFVYAAQCMATFAIIKRETNSWKWPVLMVLYMTTLAYIAALIVYQTGIFLGFV